MLAYCDRRGRIEFGQRAPSGTLVIANAPSEQLRPVIEGKARLGRDGATWWVPGIPEAPNDRAALAALTVFARRVRTSIKLRAAKARAREQRGEAAHA